MTARRHTATIQRFVAGLDVDDEAVAEAVAAQALEQGTVVASLVRGLGDAEAVIRLRAARGLAGLGERIPSVIEALLASARADGDPRVRAAATDALELLGALDALSALSEAESAPTAADARVRLQRTLARLRRAGTILPRVREALPQVVRGHHPVWQAIQGMSVEGALLPGMGLPGESGLKLFARSDGPSYTALLSEVSENLWRFEVKGLPADTTEIVLRTREEGATQWFVAGNGVAAGDRITFELDGEQGRQLRERVRKEGEIGLLLAPEGISTDAARWVIGSAYALPGESRATIAAEFTETTDLLLAGPAAAVALGNSRGTQVAVTGGEEGVARVQRIEDGKQVLAIADLGGPVSALACATRSDGIGLAVAAGDDGWALAWDLDTGEPLAELPTHAAPVRAVAVGTVADGTTISLTGAKDGAIHATEIASGVALGVLERHDTAVRSLALETLPGGRAAAASGTDDGTARLWDPTTGDTIVTLEEHPLPVQALTLGALPDGRPVAVTASGPAIRVFEVDTGERLALLAAPDHLTDAGPGAHAVDLPRAPTALALAEDGTLIATAGGWVGYYRGWVGW